MAATLTPLPGERMHFQHGPIDIVIGAEGKPDAIAAAHAGAWRRFQTVLDELVAELDRLRMQVGPTCPLSGPIARRMWSACAPWQDGVITPMAAVAGAVAQELISHYERPGVFRAWVNNGGDIAWHLTPGTSLQVGLFTDLARLDEHQLRDGIRLDGNLALTYEAPSRGLATSGWRGRSFSRGIADSVTVFARSAAEADAAATMIANAVDVDDPRIIRKPACELKDDSDLGETLVTVEVPPLDRATLRRALLAGYTFARAMRDAGLIDACTLVCQGRHAVVSAGRSDARFVAFDRRTSATTTRSSKPMEAPHVRQDPQTRHPGR